MGIVQSSQITTHSTYLCERVRMKTTNVTYHLNPIFKWKRKRFDILSSCIHFILPVFTFGTAYVTFVYHILQIAILLHFLNFNWIPHRSQVTCNLPIKKVVSCMNILTTFNIPESDL